MVHTWMLTYRQACIWIHTILMIIWMYTIQWIISIIETHMLMWRQTNIPRNGIKILFIMTAYIILKTLTIIQRHLTMSSHTSITLRTAIYTIQGRNTFFHLAVTILTTQMMDTNTKSNTIIRIIIVIIKMKKSIKTILNIRMMFNKCTIYRHTILWLITMTSMTLIMMHMRQTVITMKTIIIMTITMTVIIYHQNNTGQCVRAAINTVTRTILDVNIVMTTVNIHHLHHHHLHHHQRPNHYQYQHHM